MDRTRDFGVSYYFAELDSMHAPLTFYFDVTGRYGAPQLQTFCDMAADNHKLSTHLIHHGLPKPTMIAFTMPVLREVERTILNDCGFHSEVNVVRVYAAEDCDSLGAGLSPCLIASASLTYLPCLLLPLVAVAIPLVAVAVAIPLVAVAVAVPLVAVAVAVPLIAVVAVRIVPVRGIPVEERRTISTGKDELVTAAPVATAPVLTAPVSTAPVAAAAECRSASGRHRHVPMAVAATTTPRTSVYWRRD
jgi:hypothetical protein